LEERRQLRLAIDRRQREQTREPGGKSDRELFRGDPGYVGRQPTRGELMAQKRRAKK
jgi:hypothetical protein